VKSEFFLVQASYPSPITGDDGMVKGHRPWSVSIT
jgi:hypothetical protein